MAEENKVAVITNCTAYGGPASVMAMTRENFVLHCHDPAFSDPEEREAFQAAHPGATIAEADGPEALIEEAVSRHGRIDSLISNDCNYQITFELDLPDFRHALDVLTVAPYRLCAASIPHMRKQGGGSIVLVTSGGPLTNPILADDGAMPTHYMIGREAAHTLVRCLAREHARDNIQVNAIAPFMLYSQTFFPSDIGPDDPAYEPWLAKRVPMRRFGLDEELALMVRTLASGKGGFFSGQVVAFSGAGA